MIATIENLTEVSAQDVFDTVATHLLTQNKKCQAFSIVDDIYVCTYRNGEGLKCAAGCLIPDHLYSKDLEGRGWGRLHAVFPDIISDSHMALITRLQGVHDSYDPEDWVYCLGDVADTFDLKFNPKEAAK